MHSVPRGVTIALRTRRTTRAISGTSGILRSNGVHRDPMVRRPLCQGGDWRSLAYWIHDHLPYSRLQFFPKLAAFNISWNERPVRSIYSFVRPAGYLLRGTKTLASYAEHYPDFPPLTFGQ